MSGEATARLCQARESLRIAIVSWSRYDAAGMDSCRRQLEDSVEQVRLLQSAIQDLPVQERDPLRIPLSQFKAEIAVASRSMDSAAAFYRAVIVGRVTGFYSAAGRMVDADSRLETELQA